MSEEFKEYPYNSRYSVSNYGRVYDTQNEKFISQVLSGKPEYFYVNMYIQNKRKLLRVHRVVAETWLDSPIKGKETIDHIDRNKFNNSLTNLRWASRKEQTLNRNVALYYKSVLLGRKLRFIYFLEYYKVEQHYSMLYTRLIENNEDEHKALLIAFLLRDFDIKSCTLQQELLLLFKNDIHNYNKDKVKSILDLMGIGFSLKEAIRGYREELLQGVLYYGMWFPCYNSLCEFYKIHATKAVIKQLRRHYMSGRVDDMRSLIMCKYEEVDEFLVEFDAKHVVKATEEAGDVLQVLVSSIVHVVGKHERVVLDNIIDAYYRKYEERGGFEYRFVLELDDRGTPYV